MLYSLAKPRGGHSEQLQEAGPLLGRYFPLSRQAQRSQSMHVLNRSVVASRFLL